MFAAIEDPCRKRNGGRNLSVPTVAIFIEDRLDDMF
jgi:hypothetical protein